jgi:tetratricopeptide (TPR) repeat protein
MGKQDSNEHKIEQSAVGNNIVQVAGDYIDLVSVDRTLDGAQERLQAGEYVAGLRMAENIWRLAESKMIPRQRYRTKALMGHAFDGMEKMDKAAECWLEAKDYDPAYERARAHEALAYLYLGSMSKAHDTAMNVLKEFSEEKLARSVWIQSSPDTQTFEEIEKVVPEHQRKDPEVAMALAMRAMKDGIWNRAEEYCGIAKGGVGENARIEETMGELAAQKGNVSEQLANNRTPSDIEKDILLKSINAYDNSFEQWKRNNNTKGMVRILLKRATVKVALGMKDEAKDDYKSAYLIDSTDIEAAFHYGAICLIQGDYDKGIPIYETLRKRNDVLPSVHLVLARGYLQRNNPSDKDTAYTVLNDGFTRIQDLPGFMRFEYLNDMICLECDLNGLEPTLTRIDGLCVDLLSTTLCGLLKIRLYLRNGKIGEGKDEANKVFVALGNQATRDEKRELAPLLGELGLFKEAFSIYREIVSPEYIGQDTYRLFKSGTQCGEQGYLLEFASRLRQNKLWDKDIFGWELGQRQRYNDWITCKRILQEFLAQPCNTEYIPTARVYLSHIGAMIGETALIETDISRLPKIGEIDAETGRIIVQFLRIGGEPEKALDFAYELVRSHWNEPEAHLAIISFMSDLGPRQIEFNMVEIIVPGTAIRFQEVQTEEYRWYIIEDSKYINADNSRNELNVNHPYSKAMMGKHIGDTIPLGSDPISGRLARIVQILPKYQFRLMDTLDRFEDWFPGRKELQKSNAVRQDGAVDLSVIERNTERANEVGKDLTQAYISGPLPINILATRMGKDLPTTMGYIASCPDLRLWCREGTNEELEGVKTALTVMNEIVVDETALVTIMQHERYKEVVKFPVKFIISEGTLHNIENWDILRYNPETMKGWVGKEGDKLVFTPSDPCQMTQEQLKARAFVDIIRKQFNVESGIIVSQLDSHKRNVDIELLGQPCLESIMLARKPGRVLWTDDLVTGIISQKTFGCQRIWTQIVFEYFAEKGIIAWDIAQSVTLNLLEWDYWFTSLNAKLALLAVEKSEWDIGKGPLKQVLRHFGKEDVVLNVGFANLAKGFLKGIWEKDTLGIRAQALTLRMLTELAGRKGGGQFVTALNMYIPKLFGMDVITAKKVMDVFKGWGDTEGGQRIIIPR